jgi:hypothetical protein
MTQGTSGRPIPSKPTPREQEMAALVQEFESGDVSLQEFCEQHEISKQRLTWWQREFRHRTACHRDIGPAASGGVPSDERVDFVEVVAVAHPPVAADARCSPTGAIRIVLPGWRHVEVEPGFDEMTLARTVQVLESLPC